MNGSGPTTANGISGLKGGKAMMECLMRVFGAVTVALLGWLVAKQRSLRSDVSDLCERMARLEGLFDGFTKCEAAP